MSHEFLRSTEPGSTTNFSRRGTAACERSREKLVVEPGSVLRRNSCDTVRSISATFVAAALACSASAQSNAFRPPAVPLVVHDPYFSVWSAADHLTDAWPTHWTGAINAICGLIRIDGQPYRFCGPVPPNVPALTQTALEVTSTRTHYRFADAGVTLDLEFLSPLVATDPDLASRAFSYLTATVASNDDQTHDVAIYVDFSAEWAVDQASQSVRWTHGEKGGIEEMHVGTVEQAKLKKPGDGVRIDWGEFVVGELHAPDASIGIGGHMTMRGAFAERGELPYTFDKRTPRAANDDWPVFAMGKHWRQVDTKPLAQEWFLAYDSGPVVELFGSQLAPCWTRRITDFHTMWVDSIERRDAIRAEALEFDRTLAARLEKVGGAKYAKLAELAYRETMGAHVIATDAKGRILMFPKENTSNGCIGTIDVIFPSAPFFLALNPDLLEAQIRPVFEYAASSHWKFPFAPHDLGTYPLANGQVYGGGETSEENQMPVEESGNLVILADALCRTRDDAKLAKEWSAQLGAWAEYLRDHGLDPANQLCTDDFAGHLARNANLAIKAIVALGAYADLLHRAGDDVKSGVYRALAEDFAKQWRKLASDGDHTVLAYGKPGTWSLKYNLIWDRVLGLKLFPSEVAAQEVRFYLTKKNRFGVPLDSRESYTKLDFASWAASLAEKRADFEALFDPLYDFANETTDRVPLSDWYGTVDGRDRGMHARSVVGGIYVPLLVPGGFAEH